MINAISIRDAFLYDETTGEFKSKNAAYKEKIVGTINRRKHSDYAVLSIKHLGAYRKVYAHRAAWMYVNGDIQDGLVVDHIDGNGLNNRIENLRIVTKAINQRNRKNKIQFERSHVALTIRGKPKFRQCFSSGSKLTSTLVRTKSASKDLRISIHKVQSHGFVLY